IGLHPDPAFSGNYHGKIDEVGLYSRALSTNEIAQIYFAGGAGKCGLAAPPSLCFPGAQVTVPGVRTNNLTASSKWAFVAVAFTGVGASTPLEVQDLGSQGHYYEFVRGALTYQDARIAAANRTFAGLPGHLATITSAAENDFISTNFNTGNPAEFAWIGG